VETFGRYINVSLPEHTNAKDVRGVEVFIIRHPDRKETIDDIFIS
jgi:hypothetical protein